MSNMEDFLTSSNEKEKFLFLAKRLADVARDLDMLSEEDKKYVVERVDILNPIGLVELYNALNEYMKY